MKQWHLVWVSVLAVLGIGYSTPAGTVYYVKPAGSNSNSGLSWAQAKQTVQGGLSTADTGSQVWVAAGTYCERITLKNGVELYGGFTGQDNETDLSDRDYAVNETILDGQQAGSVVTAPDSWNATQTDTWRIDGFAIRNGNNYNGAGIYCGSSASCSSIISNCAISGNNGSYGGGIYCSGSSPVIINCTVSGNNGIYGGGGIYCGYYYYYSPYYSSPRIANCTITGNRVNSGYSGGGIYCNDGCTPTITNTIVAFNGTGIYSSYSGAPILRSNCVYNPGGTDYSGTPPGAGDICLDPLFADRLGGNFHLTTNSPCVNAGNDLDVQADWLDLDGRARICDGRVDIGADEYDGTAYPFVPPVVRVSPSGNDANTGQSWSQAKRTVTAGINAGTGYQVWVAAGTYYERITLKNGVELYGGFTGQDNETDLSDRDYAVNETILDGQQAGSVVTAPDSWNATQTDTWRIDGFAIRNGNNYYGAGIHCGPSSSSSSTIANCTISRNNGSCGGGIYCSGSSPLIANCIINRNTGGGIYCDYYYYNSPLYASPTITNCTITGNSTSSSYSGGGIFCYSSCSPTIANNVIAFNSAGVYASGGSPVLRNNCVYNPGGTNYSGLSAGAGDISLDPLFSNRFGGDFHLTTGSPCINAGNDSDVQPGWLDMDGLPRISGSHVDIGADEWDQDRVYVPPAIHVSTVGNDANDGLTWGRAKRTITAGMTAAGPGDQVWVAAGTYYERITLKNAVALYGGFAGIDNETNLSQRNFVLNVTILDGEQAGSVVTSNGSDNATRIDGFTIRNGNASSGGGICGASSPLTITNCTISGNKALYVGGGISCGSSSTIINNVISGNTASGSGGGIHCSSSGNTIRNNTIYGNTANSSGGGICCSSSSCVIANNIVAFNNTGIYSGGGSFVLRNNCVYNPSGYNYYGLAAGAGDINVNPKLEAPGYGRFHLKNDSPCIDAGNDTDVQPGQVDMDGRARISGGRVDIGADEFDGTIYTFIPPTFHVSPTGSDANDGLSWAQAKRTITAGLGAARSGDRVWVAAGTYAERITLKPGVALYGGFLGLDNETDLSHRDFAANVTTLDGQQGGSVVTVPTGADNATRIDGFTIQNGTGTGSGSASYLSGGGIYCSSYSSPTVTNCTIRENSASGAGAGIYCSNNSSPTILYCLISGNDSLAGGGIYCGPSSSPVIREDTITGNSGSYGGGGIFCDSSSPAIAACTIRGNSASGFFSDDSGGGGICCYHQSSPTITACMIEENTAYAIGGGIYCSSASPYVGNNTISGNVAAYGGGIGYFSPASSLVINNTIRENNALYDGGGLYLYQSSPFIVNNTISGNVSSFDGGGIYFLYFSSPTISNNIIAFNSTGIYKGSGSGIPVLRNNCVSNAGYNYVGLRAGTGDISLDPGFVDHANGNLHLAAGSPCIDAGNDGDVQGGWLDMDGQPRIRGMHVDIGADEWCPERIPGDANGDGRVSFVDFAILQNNYGQTGRTFDQGDFNEDGLVTFEDFAILQNHYGQTETAGQAPAGDDLAAAGLPCGSLALTLLTLLGLMACRLNWEDQIRPSA